MTPWILPRFGDTARPWPTIVESYESLVSSAPEFAPHAALAGRLAESPYAAAGLHGLTSMHELLLGPSARVLDNPHLVVEYRPSERLFRLRYRDGSAKPWSRVASPEEVFEVIERFLIRRARWFRRTGATSPEAGTSPRTSGGDPLSGRRVLLAGVLPDRADRDREVERITAEVQKRGGKLVATVLQRRGVSRAPRPGGAAAAHAARPLGGSTFLGTGKAQELQQACLRGDIDVVLFYNALDAPRRTKLETLTGTPVLDRFQLGIDSEDDDG